MSTLTLTVLRSPDHVPAQQRKVQGGELTIGRSAECGWPLPDPLKSLSRKHCTLELQGGAWRVRDLSVNGTFVNSLASPVGREAVQALRDGDHLLLGDYEIEVRLEEPAFAAAAPVGLEPGRSPFDDPPRVGFPEGPRQGFADARLPGLDDPIDSFPSSGRPSYADPVMSDHSPASAGAFMPPQALPAAGQQLVPDDWWNTPDPGAAPLVPLTPAAPVVPVAPVAPVMPARVAHAPAAVPQPAGAFAADIALTIPPAAVPRVPLQPVMQPPVMQPATGGDLAAALAVLAAGSELSPEMVARAAADPETALRNAGALLLSAVTGLRALLIARGSVKREFRIEQTMLRTKENNPLKFAASDEQALASLLDPRTNALHFVQESINDLTVHQVATLAATQAAARALIEQMGPDSIEAEVTGGGLFPGALDKRRWEAYKRRHARLLEQFEDDFESAFGTAFARAYEQAVDRVKD